MFAALRNCICFSLLKIKSPVRCNLKNHIFKESLKAPKNLILSAQLAKISLMKPELELNYGLAPAPTLIKEREKMFILPRDTLMLILKN